MNDRWWERVVSGHLARPASRDVARDPPARSFGSSDLAGLGVAVLIFGISFGAVAASIGVSPSTATLMSVSVLGGGSQFAAIAVLASDGGPLAAVASGVLLNLRFVPLGLAVATAMPRAIGRRAALAHLIGDHSVAIALMERSMQDRRRALLTYGSVILITWTIGTAVGGFGGESLTEPYRLGLDAAFPAAFLTLLVPQLLHAGAGAAAAVGGTIAIVATPHLPAGLVLMAAAAAGTAAGVVAGERHQEPS